LANVGLGLLKGDDMAGKACVLFNKPAAFSMGLLSKNALIDIVSLLAREVKG